ncbi:hypothetical protein FH972_017891 [Carpinus fangiana]|uniref:Uncharacterized protein n=1 Tax=Carpinus fangiana TaxID=176857 RepID=A0A5N6RKS8_9ROSI|nr:hypothetical protein FH972_017891 [Carpinus fangiana]
MRFNVPPHLQMDDIKRCTFMDFGENLRSYKHEVKKSLKLKADDTKESVLQWT